MSALLLSCGVNPRDVLFRDALALWDRKDDLVGFGKPGGGN